jgi:hypothetical protein
MNFYNKIRNNQELPFHEGDKVEVIVRSPLYCSEGEEPEYHMGIITEIIYNEFSKVPYPVAMNVKFMKDGLYDDGEEEIVSFEEVEDIFIKKYEVSGYGMLNEGVTLSVTGNGVGKIIWFNYRNGSLIPKWISDGNVTRRKRITEEDMALVREISRYGAAQRFTHYVLKNSAVV